MLYQLNSLSGGHDLFMDGALNFYLSRNGHLEKVHGVELKSGGKIFKVDDYQKVETGGSLRKLLKPEDIDSTGTLGDQTSPMALPDANGDIASLKLEIARLNGVINEIGNLGNPDTDAGALRLKLAELRRKLAMRQVHAQPKLRTR